MKNILFTLAVILCFVACSKNNNNAPINNQLKVQAKVDLKSFMSMIGNKYADAKAMYKSNVDTEVVQNDTAIFLVQLEDTTLLEFQNNGGNVTNFYIEGRIADSSSQRAMFRRYGDIAKSVFGEVIGCGTQANDYTKLQALWDYIDANGYDANNEYLALWDYQNMGIGIAYTENKAIVIGINRTWENEGMGSTKNIMKVIRTMIIK